jgi:hypothetical protein
MQKPFVLSRHVKLDAEFKLRENETLLFKSVSGN